MTKTKGSVTSRMATGALWTIGMRLSVRSLGIVSVIILARLLVPEDFGIVAKASMIAYFLELVTQFDRKNECYFPNYVYDLTVFSLAAEQECFDWSWISARRDESLDDAASLKLAPKSWKNWVKRGAAGVDASRRRVVKLLTISNSAQQPICGSIEQKVLKQIYKYYSGKNDRFESLAADVVANIINKSGQDYRTGWITKQSTDHGTDFVGRLDIGSGLARAKLVLLGQAKCEKLDKTTGGNHIARTVARLRRGWIGAYVTTSHFSENVQREVLEDKWPILLVNGLRLAGEVIEMAAEQGFSDIETFLHFVDKKHEGRISHRDPTEILLE